MAKGSSIGDLNLFSSRIRWIRILGILLAVVCQDVTGNDEPSRDAEIERLLSKLNKPAVRTIQGSYGDTIDCVDVHKQPAFDHPLLKDHKIEMRPTFIPKLEGSNSSKFINQAWQEIKSCPEGTIPILRVTKSDLLRAHSLESFGMVQPDQPPEGVRTEQAGMLMRIGREVGQLYTGLAADLSVWCPLAHPLEFSSSVLSTLGLNNFDTLVAGWTVNRVLFGLNAPRFFIRWGARIGNSTRGCVNLRCPGFVQTSRQFVLGGPLHFSFYGHEPVIMHISIFRDSSHRRWWLVVDDEAVGYWPWELFPNLDGAATLPWMGVVLNRNDGGRHTTTQMGSGRFPQEGWGKAAHFGNLQYMDSSSNGLRRAHGLQNSVSYPGCYNVLHHAHQEDANGPKFFYGGPGGHNCDRA